MAGGYEDDEISPEEQATLDGLAERDRKLTEQGDNGSLPGVLSDQDERDPDKVAAAEAPAAPPPAAPAPPAPPADPNAPPAADPATPPADQPPADETLGQFMARHRAAGKNDDEIAALVENRGKRQLREGFKARRGRTPEQIAADKVAATTRKTEIAGRGAAFDAKLAEDPDAAAKALNDAAIQRDLDAEDARIAALDAEEIGARQDAAVETYASVTPDLQDIYPRMQSFGGAIGYSPEELAGISDHRDLVVLDLATRFADLLESGKVDRRGNILPQPKAANDTPVDPRLRVPAPPAQHSAPAAVTTAPPTQEAQVASAMTMSDDEFAKLPDAELRRMMGG